MANNQSNASDPASPSFVKTDRNGGGNQVEHVPVDLEIEAGEVQIRREGDSILHKPRPRVWDDYFAKGRRLAEDIPASIEDCPPQKRDDFG
ncbi:antitoxin [Imhoffiella purpurea]|uniref:antitoxin n=1 Tax=Imhoffiella purpurea TaxID=1249627 RepID=UPI00069484A6|nr:hypothetical protein [Imhoffiella purpurea]